ncbi:phosphodiesterase [Streptomyces sp. SID8366]|uniref:metallophosphoesterase n=1 Tax=unclassified Streptomyces TaxID=2593676 RepID=UPI000DBA6D73|nr:metallophosphoesterase [Streptomyces sp. PsTaAH-130]MYU06046.1 phosphodiesterase [Streptomyces sp. SID8366]MYU67477.1 phosphodiesterase [Streptomyces sp. SID69]RAJ64110.1 5'-nucleotidase [Streptomyces sp. PsTaAH-130]
MQQLIATGCFHSALPDGRRALSALRSARKVGALVVDAGDFFSGSAFHAFSGGRVEEGLLAELYDAVVPGNHDFPDLMRLRRPEAFPPVVCANVSPPAAFAGRWTSGLLLHGAGLRVGIVGYLGEQAYEAIPQAERAGFTYRAPTAMLIAAEAEALRSAGADVVVGVSHSGFLVDVADQEAEWPLTTVISSHCHSPWTHWTQGTRHVAKPAAQGAGLLRLDLGVDGLLSVRHDDPAASGGPEQPHVEAELKAFTAWGDQPVGRLASALPRREDAARLLAAGALHATGADAFVLNTYTLRAGLPSEVTRAALWASAPFDSDLVVLDGTHSPRALAAQARELGEALTVAPAPASDRSGRIATTAYLAGRLGLPARLPAQPCTLHGALTAFLETS